MTRPFLFMICAGIVAIGGCQSAQPGVPPPDTVTVTAPAPSVDEPAPTGSVTTTASTARQWAMPNMVGMTVQQAQDAIQALTGNAIFVSTSHDATGKGRNQVLDANWKVCSQNVPAGAAINADTRIDFGAVKLSETCP